MASCGNWFSWIPTCGGTFWKSVWLVPWNEPSGKALSEAPVVSCWLMCDIHSNPYFSEPGSKLTPSSNHEDGMSTPIPGFRFSKSPLLWEREQFKEAGPIDPDKHRPAVMQKLWSHQKYCLLKVILCTIILHLLEYVHSANFSLDAMMWFKVFSFF